MVVDRHKFIDYLKSINGKVGLVVYMYQQVIGNVQEYERLWYEGNRFFIILNKVTEVIEVSTVPPESNDYISTRLDLVAKRLLN